jgi:sigma-B regulation protein RsbU (phosphoserine phosphatase)
VINMPVTVPGTDELNDTAPCGLLVTATDGTFLKVNTTFLNWVGYSAGELIGLRRLQDLFTMGARIFHQTHWVPTLQMQGSLAEVKFDLKHKDGKSIPMLLNARRRKRSTGDFDEIAAFVAEDRNRYERELMAARKKADGLLESQRQAETILRDRALFAEQMVGIVSHDLRNPLSAILMGVKILERGDSERRARVLGHVRDSAERAKRLIEELLDFTQARIGEGLQIQRRRLNIQKVAASAIEEIKLARPEAYVVIEPHGSGECECDEGRLTQLLINLVSNAIAYGRADSPIVVRAGVENETASISVHNLGEPIAEAMLVTIFEPMVRGVPGTTTQRSVGLGLYIVKEIARAHEGEISVVSDSSHGTTFTLTFPARLSN